MILCTWMRLTIRVISSLCHYKTAVSENIMPDDLHRLEDGISQFCQSYQELYTRWKGCTSNFHGMHHLVHCVKTCGPMSGYWQAINSSFPDGQDLYIYSDPRTLMVMASWYDKKLRHPILFYLRRRLNSM
ncbi:hypothetical protein POJ06DRAFT_36709 [Lipomyces tetrasporus]|uniref:Uncharacterized protein n=1 Tax=Lipomyces tetrasporus TaxID=54092 RepID=A0AAD7QKI7_9ASCO|nr:uncharacterized protein POJ06DRAFT_36709 [Lipomyces tetrasporus]KAJ8096957.1 hypothetical protein POJ06DRAFT_36709 [Lipomyces tetrasporus]